MCAILQLVSAPLNPIPIAEHFRRLAVAATAPTDSCTTFAIKTATTPSITVRQSSLVFISQLFLLNLKCVDSFYNNARKVILTLDHVEVDRQIQVNRSRSSPSRSLCL